VCNVQSSVVQCSAVQCCPFPLVPLCFTPSVLLRNLPPFVPPFRSSLRGPFISKLCRTRPSLLLSFWSLHSVLSVCNTLHWSTLDCTALSAAQCNAPNCTGARGQIELTTLERGARGNAINCNTAPCRAGMPSPVHAVQHLAQSA
jgi:hypothetical protein